MTSIHNTSDAGRVLIAEKMHHRFTNKITRQQAVVVVLAIFIIFIGDQSLKNPYVSNNALKSKQSHKNMASLIKCSGL
jgi:hypothetical protein